MRIAFYAPMNPAASPGFSGDRLMARQLIALLGALGHEVTVASRLRAWLNGPDALAGIAAEAGRELMRMSSPAAGPAPDLWFTYHLYYKAPDLLGPAIAARLGIPYVAAEASHAPKRHAGPWAPAAEAAMAGLCAARVLLALTPRDAEGLLACGRISAAVRLFPPFLGAVGPPAPPRSARAQLRLVTVAMMRAGSKLESYRLLARALAGIDPALWRLTLVGDGPARDAVAAAFTGFADAQVRFAGACAADEVGHALDTADIFVWPGIGEAYGMAYLEAQERGLPVIAMDSGGVAAVVRHGVSGLLVPEGDANAFADAVRTLMTNPDLRLRLSSGARAMVLADHGPEAAGRRLGEALDLAITGSP